MQASNKKQQPSAKKQKKIAIKNALASPFANYWPLLSPEDNTTITETLASNLPRIKNEKINVPWKELKNIPREERKTFRDSFVKEKMPDRPSNIDRSNIVLGVNQVTVALEEKLLVAVVIASDVQPRFMVKHIIDMCVLYRVPVLVATDLRKTLQTACGVTSLVIGLKSTFLPDSKLSLIHQSIKKLSENLPVPKNHINFKRSIKIDENQNKNNDNADKDTGMIEVGETKTGDNCKNSHDIEKSQQSVTEKDVSESEETNDEILKRIYLVKKAPEDVAFVPKFSGCGSTRKADKMEVDSAGFLSFSAETASVKQIPRKISGPKTDHNVNYKSLVIKRLKGNGDRNKKKIDRLKTKKK